MRSTLAAVAVAATCLACSSPGLALDGWEQLGSRSVEFRQDVDTIAVGRREGSFRRIMFQVDGSALEMDNVRVRFGNGASFSPPTKLVFSDRDRSRAIDLPGANRFIESITFSYRSLNQGQGRAVVTVYAQ